MSELKDQMHELYGSIGMFIGVVMTVLTKILIIMLVWDWIVPELFGWESINYLQSAGLFLLIQLLWPNVTASKNEETIE